MNAVLRLLPLALLSACAAAPPAVTVVYPGPGDPAVDGFVDTSAVRAGPWISVSAVTGFDATRRSFPETYREQAERAFANLRQVLEAAGARMDDVVEITTYQLDMSRLGDTRQAKDAAFGAHRPAWTALGASGLPLPGMQMQVAARAYVSASAASVAPPVAKPAAPAPVPMEAPGSAAPQPRFNTRPGY